MNDYRFNDDIDCLLSRESFTYYCIHLLGGSGLATIVSSQSRWAQKCRYCGRTIKTAANGALSSRQALSAVINIHAIFVQLVKCPQPENIVGGKVALATLVFYRKVISLFPMISSTYYPLNLSAYIYIHVPMSWFILAELLLLAQ